MDTESLYKKLFLEDCFNQLKQIRNQWTKNQWSEKHADEDALIPTSLSNLGGIDFDNYSFLIEQSSNWIYQTICKLIFKLLGQYQYSPKGISVNRCDAYQFISKDTHDGPVVYRGNERAIHSFVISKEGVNELYVIKQFGIDERLPGQLEEMLKEVHHVTVINYVSLVMGGAESEQLNYDPASSNIKLLSLEQFFSTTFSPDEFRLFSHYYTELKNRANDYYGLRLSKSLQHMELGHFKRDLMRELKEHDYSLGIFGGALRPSQKAIVDDFFFRKETCEAVVGSTPFAESFATAEWLYGTLKGSRNVDLTPVALGYFKAVEQFLFALIHTLALGPDKKVRDLFVYSEKKEITEDLLTGDLTLGVLKNFFGFYKKSKNEICLENSDLLNPEIDESTHRLIFQTLDRLKEIRNGYLHKDNLHDWAEVERIRNQAFSIFYLLLGSYRFEEAERAELDVNKKTRKSDYFLLCEYIDSASRSTELSLDVPIFYLSGKQANQEAYLACSDNGIINYDRYGCVFRSNRYTVPPSIGTPFRFPSVHLFGLNRYSGTPWASRCLVA